MTRRIRFYLIQIALTLVAIVAILSWGVFAVTWTYPSDQGGTLSAVLNGERNSVVSTGLKGNGTIIGSHSEAQFIVFLRTTISVGVGSGTYSIPGAQGFAYGPILWTPPISNLTSFEAKYAVISFAVSSSLFQPGPDWWFSGPQGNLTVSLATSHYGGIENSRPSTTFQTNIFQESGPGNYTLHFYNPGSANATSIVALGNSSVAFTHPYFYSGVTTILIAVTLSILTGVVLVK